MPHRPPARLLLIVAVALLLTGCGATPAPTPLAPDASPSPAPTPAADAFPDAPALVGARRGVAGDVLTGPTAPVVIRAHPGAEPVVRQLDPARGQFLASAPTGDLAAYLQPPTAVAKAAVRVDDVATGQQRDLVELTGQRLVQLWWSPDGRSLVFSDDGGFHVHRLGGPTADLAVTSGGRPAFTSDATASGVALCSDRIDRTSVFVAQIGVAAATVEQPGLCDGAGQTVTAAGDPVGVFVTPASTLDPQTRVLRASTSGPPTALPMTGLAPGTSVRLAANAGPSDPCPGGVVRFERGGIVDVTTGTATGTPASDSCPVPSPDHRRYAVASSAGPVVVVEAGTAQAIEVAAAGTPVVWTPDGSALAVEGRGTFVVRADGSGARPAAVQIAPGPRADQGRGAFCRVGDTGKAVVTTATGPVLYDVAADAAVPLPDATTGERCWVTPDSRWLVTGTLAVDVPAGRGLALLAPAQSPSVAAYAEHRWVGPQIAFPVGRTLR